MNICEFENIKIKFEKEKSEDNPLDIKTNLLLNKHLHYLSDNLYDGYESDEDLSFRIGDEIIFKSIYRSISDVNIIRKLIKWIKYLPYENHNIIMLEMIFDVFNRYGDHLKKIINGNYIYSIIVNPLKRILWILLENWINEYVEKTYINDDRFNSILYDILNFVTSNSKLFIL